MDLKAHLDHKGQLVQLGHKESEAIQEGQVLLEEMVKMVIVVHQDQMVMMVFL